MARSYRYTFFVLRNVKGLLISFTQRDVLKELLRLIEYRQINLINNKLLAKEFPRVHHLEREFLLEIIEVYHEIEQMLFISPPKIHIEIREQLQEEIEDLELAFTKSELKERIIEELPTEYKNMNKTKFNILFIELSSFFTHLLNRIKDQTIFFTSDETKFTSEEHLKIVPQLPKNDHLSAFADVNIKSMLKDPVRFKIACDKLLSSFVYQGKRYTLMTKTSTDEYEWLGSVKSGIPSLASFVACLEDKKILRFAGGNIQRVNAARSLLSYFNKELSHCDFFLKSLRSPEHNLPLIEAGLKDI